MKYFIILLLSIALLIWLEYREHRQPVTKAPAIETTTPIIEPVQLPAQQHQAQTNAEKQTISGFSSRVVYDTKTFNLPDGGTVGFREGTFGDKFTSFLGINSTEIGERFIFDNVTFYTGSANLSARSFVEVAKVAEVLKAFPKVHIKIEGHTDALGDPAKNMELSFARANAIRNQLVAVGINSHRLSTVGFGSAKPANKNNPTAKENRRIEIVLTKR